MNNEKISGFKRNHAGGDEKLVVLFSSVEFYRL